MVLVDAAEEQVVHSHLALFRKAVVSQRVARVLAEFGVTRLLVARLVKRAQAEGRIAPDARPDDVAAAISFSARPSALSTSVDQSSAYWLAPVDERGPGGFGALGSRPLIVIRHGQPFSGLNAPLAELEPGWADGQMRLRRSRQTAGLSWPRKTDTTSRKKIRRSSPTRCTTWCRRSEHERRSQINPERQLGTFATLIQRLAA